MLEGQLEVPMVIKEEEQTTSVYQTNHSILPGCRLDEHTCMWLSSANTNGVIFYHTEVKCNGIPCLPYDTQKEVTCVVCTK